MTTETKTTPVPQTTVTPEESTSAVLSLSEERSGASESLYTLALRRLRRDYLTLVAIAIVLLLALLSLLAPVITDALNVSYTRTDSAAFLSIGSPGHILGTDDLGRDELARLLYAGRVSLTIAFSAAIGSLAIGVTVGVIAGYYQGGPLGFIDDAIMWFVTTLNSIPTLFLLLIVASVLRAQQSALGSSVVVLILILTFLGWTGTMRLVRGETLARRELEYTIAARAMGAGSWRIMFVHILPNVFSIIVVTLAIDVGSLILVESALSYLGLGVRPPTPSWGNMLNNAQSFFDRGPHLVFLPGFLIVLTVLCLYIIGDGMRDAFDPQASKKVA
ncbi:MAG: ABC transporter permease [Chloroflexota bacterium]|jgi:peptide/nickel transport system permease protein